MSGSDHVRLVSFEEMRQDGAKVRLGHEDPSTLTDDRPDPNAAEPDEEIDSRGRLEIADTIPDERRRSMRPRTDRTDDEFLPASAGQKRTLIECFVGSVGPKSKINGMDCSRRNAEE